MAAVFRQRRPREQRELAPARTVVQPALAAVAELRRQAYGDQRAMQFRVVDGDGVVSGRRRLSALRADLIGRGSRATRTFCPSPHSSSSHSSFNCRCSSRHHSRRRRKPRNCLSAHLRNCDWVMSSWATRYASHSLRDADELRLRIGELRVRGVGGAALVGRAFARVLDAETAAITSIRAGSRACAFGDQHAQASRRRQPRHRASDRGELAPASIAPSSTTAASRRRLRAGPAVRGTGSPRSRPSPSDSMRRITLASVARDGFPDRCRDRGRNRLPNTGESVPGAMRPQLMRAGRRWLRDRLDVQAVEFLLPRAVALHARQGIDDVVDARHRQRGFGDVGRQHDTPRCGPGWNTRSWSRAESRAYSGSTSVWRYFALLQRLVDVADLAFAGRKISVSPMPPPRGWISSQARDDAVEQRAAALGCPHRRRRPSPSGRQRTSTG